MLRQPVESDADVVFRLAEGTARTTGEEFFQSLVRNLCLAMGVAYAFVAEFAGPPSRVRTRALWGPDGLRENIEYDLAGTPCAEVVDGAFCHHPRELRLRFPDDPMLVELGVESYIGVPLRDAGERALGHLAVMDTEAMHDEPRRLFIFQIFAARAAAELERLRAEARLLETEQRFRDLYEEAPIAYVYEDPESRFLSANRAAMSLLGLRPEEVAGTVGSSLLAPTEVTRQRVDDAFRDLKQGKAHGASRSSSGERTTAARSGCSGGRSPTPTASSPAR